MVLFPVWAWMLANSVGKYKFFILALAVFNIVNLFRHNFYTYGPNLPERLELVGSLPSSFRLENFSGNPNWASYLDNYRYLLWWRGKNYQDESGITYSIYDGSAREFVQPLGSTVYHFSGQKLIKYDY